MNNARAGEFTAAWIGCAEPVLKLCGRADGNRLSGGGWTQDKLVLTERPINGKVSVTDPFFIFQKHLS